MRLKKMIFPILCGLLIFSAPSAVQGSENSFVLKAAKIFTGEGSPIENGAVIVMGGKIHKVGQNIPLPQDLKVIHLEKAVVAPGLVDIHTALGAQGYNVESASAVEPQARAADLFHPGHRDFRLALQEGITTVLLVPSNANLVGGLAAAVKTGGACPVARMVRKDGPLKCAFGTSVVRQDRVPTSRMGALHMFREMLEKSAKTEKQGVCPVAEFSQGRLDGLIRCGSAGDVCAAAALVKEFNLHATLVFSSLLDKALAEAAQAGIPLVMGPLGFASSPRMLREPAKAYKAGLKLAFTSNAPAGHPAGLRISAGLAHAHGLDASTALKAITKFPAEMAGVDKRVGTLTPGKDADLVLFSGDPLDPASRILKVFINGAQVYCSCGCCTGKNCCK